MFNFKAKKDLFLSVVTDTNWSIYIVYYSQAIYLKLYSFTYELFKYIPCRLMVNHSIQMHKQSQYQNIFPLCMNYHRILFHVFH